jgi:Family of unknown function (DUF6297)
MSGAPLARDRPLEAGPVLALLRSYRRGRRVKSRWDRFTDVYTVVLFAVFAGFLAFGALRESAVAEREAVRLIDELTRWSPTVLFLASVAALRYSTWQGPVLFSLPDVEWLISAPLSRAELIRSRLRRGLTVAAGIGAALGLAAFVLIAAELGVAAWPLFAATVGGLATLGLLAGAAGWLVESSTERARMVLRASPLVIPLAIVLALLPAVAAGGVALWSGPWGWATGPVVAAVGEQIPGWPYQVVLLVTLTSAAVWTAWRNADAAPAEELARRAGMRSGLVAALYFADVRGASLLVRRARASLLGVRRTKLRRPWSSQLAIPWRDALSTARAPTRLAWVVSLVVAGVIAILAVPDRRAILVAGLLAGYVAGAKGLEPLRLEADQPDAHHVLPLAWGQLLLRHCVVPVLVLIVPAVVTVIVAWMVTSLGSDAAASALILCPLVSATLVLCAAIAAKRGPFPIELLLLGGDVGIVVLVVWLATGPILAALALAVPAGLMYGAAEDTISISQAAGAAAGVLLVTLILTAAYLGSRWQPA